MRTRRERNSRGTGRERWSQGEREGRSGLGQVGGHGGRRSGLGQPAGGRGKRKIGRGGSEAAADI